MNLTPAACDTCALRRTRHAAVVVGNWIYVDGGLVVEQDGVTRPENATLSLDLSTDWTNASLNLIRTPRPTSNSMALSFQSLWWSEKNNVIYCFGGERQPYQTTLPESIWGFIPNGRGSGDWIQQIGPNTAKPFPSQIIRPANGASAFDNDGAYYLGGFAGQGTTNAVDLEWGLTRPVPGLLTFDFSSQMLTNSSNDGDYFSSIYREGQSLQSGNMLNVPFFGNKGILLMIGGGDNTGRQGNFNNVTVFDKDLQKWYSQTASGDIPDSRMLFCAVGVQGGDNSTYEIFIFGGLQYDRIGSVIETPAQIGILTLPAFRWFQANNITLPPRVRHQCLTTGTNQMISIGGVDPFQDNNIDTKNTTADPWAQGIGVFDMTSLQWKDSYQSKADKYRPPDVIRNYYSQSTSRYPSSWTSPEVQKLFDTSSKNTSDPHPLPPSNSSSSPRPSTPPVSQSVHQTLNAAAIAGIVVGCIVAILVSAVGLWLLRRQRRGNKNHFPQRSDVNGQHRREYELETIEATGELSVTERVQEFEVGPSAWELPVGTMEDSKAARRSITEIHG